MGWLKFIASSLGTVSFLSIYVLLLKIWPAAGLQTFGTSALPQHLQGVLNHGRNFTIYRTFHNIINDSNLQIHCFLLSLESTLRAEHKLPDTVYYQVDGGSENIAKVVHLICELIIARRLTKKIVLSRLMVGHTHEDIDARFGVIWSSIRQEHVLSPQMYASMIRRSFDRSFPVEVEDIWIVPNYTKLLSPCMDKKFGRYAKGEWTQLQFIFQSVPVETDFPLGVKTTYRRYCADQVMEVERNDAFPCGFSSQQCQTVTYPVAKVANEDGRAQPEGMYILQKFPISDQIEPCAFKRGGRAEFDETMRKVRQVLQTPIINQWEEFSTNVPENDDAVLYLQQHPNSMRIPLRDVLFTPCGVADAIAESHISRQHQGQIVRSTESVVWSNRGRSAPAVTRPTQLIQGTNTSDSLPPEGNQDGGDDVDGEENILGATEVSLPTCMLLHSDLTLRTVVQTRNDQSSKRVKSNSAQAKRKKTAKEVDCVGDDEDEQDGVLGEENILVATEVSLPTCMLLHSDLTLRTVDHQKRNVQSSKRVKSNSAQAKRKKTAKEVDCVLGDNEDDDDGEEETSSLSSKRVAACLQSDATVKTLSYISTFLSWLPRNFVYSLRLLLVHRELGDWQRLLPLPTYEMKLKRSLITTQDQSCYSTVDFTCGCHMLRAAGEKKSMWMVSSTMHELMAIATKNGKLHSRAIIHVIHCP